MSDEKPVIVHNGQYAKEIGSIVKGGENAIITTSMRPPAPQGSGGQASGNSPTHVVKKD